jgi:probable HAF family extracellular repeat protein
VVSDLGTLGGYDVYATDINESSDVVGVSLNGTGSYHAFVYSNGVLQDLSSLIDQALSLTLTYTADINDLARSRPAAARPAISAPTCC